MTSDGEKCGLSSLLPMSCRGRAVAFAKSLHSRLTSLNSDNDSPDESSWLTDPENHIATSQPHRHVLDYSPPTESPGSPVEHLDELQKLIINGDVASQATTAPACQRTPLKCMKNSSDSDSDVYYDIDNDSDLERRLVNGSGRNHDCRRSQNCTEHTTKTHITNGTSSPNSHQHEEEINKISYDSGIPTTGDCTSESTEGDEESSWNADKSEETDFSTTTTTTTHDEFFSTQSDLSSISMSNDSSTLSLRDEDCNITKSQCNGEAKPNNKEPDKEDDVGHYLEMDRSCTKELSKDTEDINENDNDDDHDDDDDDEDDDLKIPRVRRCSSLKTGKTPPGTPGRKKIVRFADALGLDLADVRTFLDEIPKVPVSAYEDLSVDMSDSSSTELSSRHPAVNNAYHGLKTDKILMPLFQQPGGLVNFLDMVRDNLVCLENALVDDPYVLSIKGMVRVRNLDFHKSVHVRYTLNGWKTFADVQAIYVPNSCDGFSDKFSFVIYAHTLTVGQRLEFACRFQCKGCQYWDNNNGKNYVYQCLPAMNQTSSIAPIVSGDEWGASFY